MKDNMFVRVMTEIDAFREFSSETRELLVRYPALGGDAVADAGDRPRRRRRRRVKKTAKKLHWTQRPENAKRLAAMLKKTAAARAAKK